MASSSAREEEGKEVEEQEEDGNEEASSHLPLAPPSDELPDISTTVDPSYIISLIRQLLPCDVRVDIKSPEIDSNSYIDEAHSLDQTMTGVHSCGKMVIATKTPVGNGIRQHIVEEEKNGVSCDGQAENSGIKDTWEDSGCILWDLSASRTHAEFMVNNLLLEVLLANLQVSRPFRVTEICLGIIGNLACYSALSDIIISTNGLIGTIVDQLFLDDSACLSETFRLLAVGLQGSGFACWAASLLPEQILQRILWITGNTLNYTLLERNIEFFLAIVDNQEVAAVLLPPLYELGLSNLVVNLLTCELSKLKDENKLDRSSILDAILRLVEALSTIDIYPQVISSSEKLLLLVCDVIKLPEKIEVDSSCASAVVIIANLLVDVQHLTSELSQDLPFLQGLLDILPFVSKDSQARNALWSILARLLIKVQENDMSTPTLCQFASLFLDKSSLIEEDLDGHPTDHPEDQGHNDNERSYEIVTALKRISCILQKWITKKPALSEKDVAGRDKDDSKVNRLLNYCHSRVHC